MTTATILHKNGAWNCENGKLHEVGSNAEKGSVIIDARDAEVMPGRICSHTHIYSGLCPLGMPAPENPPQNFIQILERIWWRLDRALDADILRACARYYAAESLLLGTTTLIDHHESPCFIEGSLDVLSDACDEMGIRALLCYGATERNFGIDEGRRGLAECKRFIQNNKRELQRGAVSLHASFTCSDELISESAAMCKELGAIMHVHVAEDKADVEDAQHRGYISAFHRLATLKALPSGSIVAHGIWLDPKEVRKAEEMGLWFVQNPRSNQGNKVGYPSALANTQRVALGVDGYVANMKDEAKVLFELSAAHNEPIEIPTLRCEMGAAMNESIFGMPFTLTENAAADVVVEKDGQVRDVIVGGKPVVVDGKLITADINEIRAEAAVAAEKLWAKMKALP